VRTHSSVKQTVASPVKGPETTTTKNTKVKTLCGISFHIIHSNVKNKKNNKKEEMHILQCHFESNSVLKWSGIGRPRDLKFRYQTMTNGFSSSKFPE
jgi:hypothetical protein